MKVKNSFRCRYKTNQSTLKIQKKRRITGQTIGVSGIPTTTEVLSHYD